MTAAIQYYLRLIAYRQSALPPILSYLALLAMVFANDAGPPVAAATATSVALMPVCAWLMRVAGTSESRPFAEMTSVALGGGTRRLMARTGAAALLGCGLSVLSVIWARVANPHPYPASTLAIVLGMHLAEVIAGIGVGALLAPPLRVAAGAAIVATTALVLLSLLISWMPPLGPVLYRLDRDPVPGAPTLLVAISQAAVFGGLSLLTAGALGRRAP